MWLTISDKVFKNGPSKICERQTLKNFTWSFLEYFVPYIYTTKPIKAIGHLETVSLNVSNWALKKTMIFDKICKRFALICNAGFALSALTHTVSHGS